MFAYCGNSPVNGIDETGEFSVNKSWWEYECGGDDDDDTGSYSIGSTENEGKVCRSWQETEKNYRASHNSVESAKERTFETSQGKRIADHYNKADKLVAEIKTGSQSFTSRLNEEIIKDKWILDNTDNIVEWHFFESPISGTIGGTMPLYKALHDAGIKIFIHLD